MSKYLVTGGTGFIGRWVVAKLDALGHEVRVFDNLPNLENLEDASKGLSERVEVITGDIADGSVRQAAEGCDGIVHLAGILTLAAAADPLRGAEINVIGSVHVFEAAKEQNMARIVYVSSSGVFGPEDPTNPKPMSNYGAQKLAIEGFARAAYLDHGLHSVGFRPYVVYGPGKSSGIAAGPSIAISAALRSVPSKIAFSGRVGFVHAVDVAECMVVALLSDLEGAEAYNLCGETADVEDFKTLLKARLPQTELTIEGPPMRIPADLATSLMPAPLSEVPVTGLADGIEGIIQHYSERSER